MLAALVDSCLKAKKHTHPETDGWKDKMEHTAKRLRAERNIYISGGTMFAFVVLCQLWVMIKRVSDLEADLTKMDNNHNLLKKQIAGNQQFQQALTDQDDGGAMTGEEAADLRAKVQMLQEENERLSEQLSTFLDAQVCMYVCVYDVCMYACVYVCVYVCMIVCMYACI